jgi:hypothetical protein
MKVISLILMYLKRMHSCKTVTLNLKKSKYIKMKVEVTAIELNKNVKKSISKKSDIISDDNTAYTEIPKFVNSHKPINARKTEITKVLPLL